MPTINGFQALCCFTQMSEIGGQLTYPHKNS
jgi:hypothetical protein